MKQLDVIEIYRSMDWMYQEHQKGSAKKLLTSGLVRGLTLGALAVRYPTNFYEYGFRLFVTPQWTIRAQW